MDNYTLTYDSKLKLSKWVGYPDADYSWEGGRLSYERKVKNEEGKERTVKTYKDPFEIIADFKAESKVLLASDEIEVAVARKFGPLKGFVWLEKVSGGGEVILPFVAPHIFIATGDRLNPILTEIFTDPNEDNYYEIIKEDIDGELVETGKTRVFVKSFSGVGGAGGSSPTLIAHYKMNDNLATAVVIDSTGNHNGEYQIGGVAQNTNTSNVLGKINRALDFIGGANGEHIEIADHTDFTPALTPFSISVGVYMLDATSFPILSKGVYNTDAEWRLQTDAGGKLQIRIFDENVDNCYIDKRYDTDLRVAHENQWLHIVGTYSGGTTYDSLKLYLDGTRIDDIGWNAGSFATVRASGHDVWIGRYDSTYADGLIDNVMFFGVELTPDEVKRLYNNGHGTEIPADLDQTGPRARRSGNSPMAMRQRYEH